MSCVEARRGSTRPVVLRLQDLRLYASSVALRIQLILIGDVGSVLKRSNVASRPFRHVVLGSPRQVARLSSHSDLALHLFLFLFN